MTSAKKNSPLISVVLPVYNGETFITKAIESVFDQKYSPLELIVVNDGSTDKTEEVLKKFEGKITYVTQENHGPANARNNGIKIAKGEYVAFIDADDVWAPESLSLHIDQFRSFRNLEISVGLTCELSFNSTRDIDIEMAKQKSFLQLSLCASVMRKSIFNNVGFFDEELILGQDTDWFLRARELGKTIAISPELVLFYRRHSNNRTNDKKLVRYYFFKVFKKAKDRKAHSNISQESVLKKPENQKELIEMWHTAEPII